MLTVQDATHTFLTRLIILGRAKPPLTIAASMLPPLVANGQQESKGRSTAGGYILLSHETNRVQPHVRSDPHVLPHSQKRQVLFLPRLPVFRAFGDVRSRDAFLLKKRVLSRAQSAWVLWSVFWEVLQSVVELVREQKSMSEGLCTLYS